MMQAGCCPQWAATAFPRSAPLQGLGRPLVRLQRVQKRAPPQTFTAAPPQTLTAPLFRGPTGPRRQTLPCQGALLDIPPDTSAKEFGLKGSIETLDALFGPHSMFTMASCQRPYLWDTEQAGQLLADVQTAQDEEDNVLILGLLVVAEPSGPASKGHLDVVDGQQRLVTLSLLMASLSWRMQEDKEEAERGRHILHKKVFLEGDPLLKRPEQLRVQLRNPADNAFLKSLLESPEVAAAAAPPPMEGKVQPLLWGNAREFAQRLAGVPPAECGRTALYLLHRMQFMKVECNSVGTALRAFITGSMRGKDMELIDLVKPQVSLHIAPDRIEAFSAEWDAEIERVGRDKMARVFNDLLPLFIGRFARKGADFEGLERMVVAACTALDARDQPGEAFYRDVVLPSIRAHERLGGDVAGEPHARRRALRALGANTKRLEWRPAAVAMLLLHHGGRWDESALLDGLLALERVCLCGMLCRWPLKSRRERFLAVVRQLGFAPAAMEPGAGDGAAPPARSPLPDAISALKLTEAERRACADALDDNVCTANDAKLAGAILARLNESLVDADDPAAVGHWEGAREELSVDHMMPQAAAASGEWTHISEEDRARWLHKLGNLMLLPRRKNSGAGNQGWAQKLQSVAQIDPGALPLTSEVLEEKRWDVPAMERRQARIRALAVEFWGLHEGPPQAQTSRLWTVLLPTKM